MPEDSDHVLRYAHGLLGPDLLRWPAPYVLPVQSVGHLAAGCRTGGVGHVNLFWEEDFLPLQVPEISVGAAVEGVPVLSVDVGSVGCWAGVCCPPWMVVGVRAVPPTGCCACDPSCCVLRGGLWRCGAWCSGDCVRCLFLWRFPRCSLRWRVCSPVPPMFEVTAVLCDRVLRDRAQPSRDSAGTSMGENSDDLCSVPKRARWAVSSSPPGRASWADEGDFETSLSLEDAVEDDAVVCLGLLQRLLLLWHQPSVQPSNFVATFIYFVYFVLYICVSTYISE